jgi:adenylosuccinate lyase
VIKKHLDEELPFMATENILMYCVREKGGDRQTLHEAIREHSVKAAEQVKLYGRPNDLLGRILADKTFGLTEEELEKLTDPATFTGMAEHQTEKFLRDEVRPVLDRHRDELGARVGITV